MIDRDSRRSKSIVILFFIIHLLQISTFSYVNSLTHYQNLEDYSCVTNSLQEYCLILSYKCDTANIKRWYYIISRQLSTNN